MIYKLHSVRISQIDQNDVACRISTPKSTNSLVESIRQIGVIHPPILMPLENSEFFIVAGFQRVAACSQLGWQDIQAHILSNDTEPLRILGLAIADNAQHRRLDLIECAIAVEKLQNFFSNDTEMIAFAKSLGLPLSQELIPRLLRLNSLTSSIKDRIACHVIPLTIALELEKLNPSDAEAMSIFFDELRPSLSQQKEILLLVREIARVADESIFEVLKRPSVMKIRLDADLERPHKLKQIRSCLKKLRYPTIQKFENAFHRSLKSLDLPSEIFFSAPPNFEGNRFSITLSFCTQAEFIARLETLQRLADNHNFLSIVNKRFEDQEAIY